MLAAPAKHHPLTPAGAQDYLVVDVLDGPDEPIRAHFGRVNAYVTAARRAGGTVLVHCHGGVSRAAALVLAYLIGEEGLSYSTAWERLRTARPVVAPNPGFVSQLRAFEKQALSAHCTDAVCVAHVASAEAMPRSCGEEEEDDVDLPGLVAGPPSLARCSTTDAPRSTSSVLSMGPDTPDAYEGDPLVATDADDDPCWKQHAAHRRASLPPPMPTSGVRHGLAGDASHTAGGGGVSRSQSL